MLAGLGIVELIAFADAEIALASNCRALLVDLTITSLSSFAFSLLDDMLEVCVVVLALEAEGGFVSEEDREEDEEEEAVEDDEEEDFDEDEDEVTEVVDEVVFVVAGAPVVWVSEFG